MIGVHGKKMVKEIIVVYNKLIIYNENQFDMVICKNLEDAQRLHHTLSKICKKQKIKTFYLWVQLLKQLELECMILYMKKLVGHILKYVN
jgi:hypothetical protein